METVDIVNNMAEFRVVFGNQKLKNSDIFEISVLSFMSGGGGNKTNHILSVGPIRNNVVSG